MALTQSAPAQAVATNRLLQQDQEPSAADQNREGKRTHQIAVPARCLSVTCPAARTLVNKPFQQTSLHHATLPPTAASQLSMQLPSEYLHMPASGIAAKLAHTCSNHFKASLTTCSFHAQTSRIVTGNKNGEMAIWDLNNGFKFVKQWSAHHMARLTVMKWSNNEQYCLTGDVNGVVKYWKPTFEPYRLGLEGRHIHQDGGILDLAWAPTDTKFVSASEDSTLCVWDMHTCALHRKIAAHSGDCTSVNWHPNTALLASGSRDTLVKLWDARTGKQIVTYHGHQDRVNVVDFHWNGNWLLSGSRDATCKLFELRMNRELHRYSAHSKDVNSVAWHPCIETLFATGSTDQSIMFWFTDNEDPAYVSKEAHAGQITCLQWHPLGHMLCSVGADAALKLWTRERPGDLLLGSVATGTIGQNQHVDATPGGSLEPAADMLAAAIPGLGGNASKQAPSAAQHRTANEALQQQTTGLGPQARPGRGNYSQPGPAHHPKPPPGPPPSGQGGPPRGMWNNNDMQQVSNAPGPPGGGAHARPMAQSGGQWRGRGGRFNQQGPQMYDDSGMRERDRDQDWGGGGRGRDQDWGRGGRGRDQDWGGGGRGRDQDWGDSGRGGGFFRGRGRSRGRGRRGRGRSDGGEMMG